MRGQEQHHRTFPEWLACNGKGTLVKCGVRPARSGDVFGDEAGQAVPVRTAILDGRPLGGGYRSCGYPGPVPTATPEDKARVHN